MSGVIAGVSFSRQSAAAARARDAGYIVTELMRSRKL